MKIIYLANVRMPTEKAHGLQIMKMCQAFALLGHEVELVVPRRRNNLAPDPFAYYGVEKNFTVTWLPCWDLIFLDRLFGNLAFWLVSATFFISAKFYLLLRRFDFVYTREEQFMPLLRPAFLEMHGLPKKIRFYHRFFWRRFKRLIVLTSYIKKSLMEQGISEKNILIAPDGVDFAEFDLDISQNDARQKLGLPLDKKLVVYTGHLYDWKGAQTLADAAKFLPDDAQVIFVGGTDDDIREFRQKNSSSANLSVVGQKPHGEIPYYLKAADVLILPNSGKEKISQFYTSPLKLFEYMASGVAIVASDLPSLREILNENNAILVEPDNPAELAKGINAVLNDRQLADKLSRRAHQEAQGYSWQKRAEKIIDFIND